MADLSPTTGEQFYSGDWGDIVDVVKTLDIEEGKISEISQQTVNSYQENADRQIDGVLEDTYHTPLRAMNAVQPDGTTKRVFPGDVRHASKYWAAALLLLNEFQQLSQNMTDQATGYLEEARRQIYAMKRFTHRIPGAKRKSHFSHTLPPNFQPPSIPEPDF